MADPLIPLVEQAPEQRPAEQRFRLDPAYVKLRTQEHKTAEYRQRARSTAEKLRYRQYVRNGTPMDVIRRTRAFAIRYWWFGPLVYAFWKL